MSRNVSPSQHSNVHYVPLLYPMKHVCTVAGGLLPEKLQLDSFCYDGSENISKEQFFTHKEDQSVLSLAAGGAWMALGFDRDAATGLSRIGTKAHVEWLVILPGGRRTMAIHLREESSPKLRALQMRMRNQGKVFELVEMEATVTDFCHISHNYLVG